MATKSKSYHVMAHPNGGWAVKKAGSHRAMRVFGTKEEATNCARNVVMRRKGARYVIHGRDGIVQKEGKFRDSPLPPNSRRSGMKHGK